MLSLIYFLSFLSLTLASNNFRVNKKYYSVSNFKSTAHFSKVTSSAQVISSSFTKRNTVFSSSVTNSIEYIINNYPEGYYDISNYIPGTTTTSYSVSVIKTEEYASVTKTSDTVTTPSSTLRFSSSSIANNLFSEVNLNQDANPSYIYQNSSHIGSSVASSSLSFSSSLLSSEATVVSTQSEVPIDSTQISHATHISSSTISSTIDSTTDSTTDTPTGIATGIILSSTSSSSYSTISVSSIIETPLLSQVDSSIPYLQPESSTLPSTKSLLTTSTASNSLNTSTTPISEIAASSETESQLSSELSSSSDVSTQISKLPSSTHLPASVTPLSTALEPTQSIVTKPQSENNTIPVTSFGTSTAVGTSTSTSITNSPNSTATSSQLPADRSHSYQNSANSTAYDIKTSAELPKPTTATTSLNCPSTSSTFNSNGWLPISLVTQIKPSTSSGVNTISSSSSASTATGTKVLPNAITAPNVIPIPEGYKLITVGFKEALNYDFVVANSVCTAQIFAFLPNALERPFSSGITDINVVRLEPLTIDSYDYTVTVAEVYFLSSQLDKLAAMIKDPNSALYSQNITTENELVSMIDPNIPLTGLVSNSSSSNSNSRYSESDSDDNSSNSGSLEFSSKSTTGSNSPIKNKGKLTGFIIGIIVAGTTYIALMILLGRYFVMRYRKRQSNITCPDDSSVSSSEGYPEKFPDLEKNSYSDNASITPSTRINNWMDSNNYEPADTQVHVADVAKKGKPIISRPIATQNSLGWNDF